MVLCAHVYGKRVFYTFVMCAPCVVGLCSRAEVEWFDDPRAISIRTHSPGHTHNTNNARAIAHGGGAKMFIIDFPENVGLE